MGSQWGDGCHYLQWWDNIFIIAGAESLSVAANTCFLKKTLILIFFIPRTVLTENVPEIFLSPVHTQQINCVACSPTDESLFISCGQVRYWSTSLHRLTWTQQLRYSGTARSDSFVALCYINVHTDMEPVFSFSSHTQKTNTQNKTTYTNILQQ